MASVEADLKLNISKLTTELDRAKRELDGFKRKAEQTGKEIDRAMAGPMNGSMGGFGGARSSFGGGLRGGNGMAMQQAGFQVADLAVQLEMGTSPMRAFIQQGSQMAGVFGPWGAVIGAAIAVLGALVPMLIKSGKSAEEVRKEMEALAPAFKAVSEVMDELASSKSDQQLARHVKSVGELLSFWERIGSQLRTNQEIMGDQRGAVEATALADIERRRAAALNGAGTEDQVKEVNKRFDAEEARMRQASKEQGAAANVAGLLDQQKAADQAMEQLRKLVPDLQQQLGDAQAGLQRLKPDGVRSDQQKMLDQLAQAEFNKREGLGDARQNDAVIANVGPMASELRAALNANRPTFELATSDQDKRAVASYQSERESGEKTAAKLKEEIAAAEAEMGRVRVASQRLAGEIPRAAAEADLLKARGISEEAQRRAGEIKDPDQKPNEVKERKALELPIGAAGNAVNILTGRGPNQLVQQTNDLIKDTNKQLGELGLTNKNMEELLRTLQTNPLFFPQ